MEAELRAIAGKICAHFDLAPVGVSIAELEIELDGVTFQSWSVYRHKSL
jgi:hypothetical protein